MNATPVMELAVPGAQSSPLREAVKQCETAQQLIEILANSLDPLRAAIRKRTYSEKVLESKKKDIRTLEDKLIKLFSQQLAARARVPGASALLKYPSLSTWLRVVGVSEESRNALESRLTTLDQLREKTESELNRILLSSSCSSSASLAAQRGEDLRKLNEALLSLRKYTDATLQGARSGHPPLQDPAELYWDSWTTKADTKAAAATCPVVSAATLSATCATSSPKPDTTSTSYIYGAVPLSTGAVLPPKPDSVASSLSSNSSLASSLPPPSPGPGLLQQTPTVVSTQQYHHQQYTLQQQQQQLPPATPPGGTQPKSTSSASSSSSNSKSDYPLTKSKSHECDLGNRINPSGQQSDESSSCSVTSKLNDNSNAATSVVTAISVLSSSRRRRQPTSDSGGGMTDDSSLAESGPSPPLSSPSPFETPAMIASGGCSGSGHSLQVPPKSPRTPRSMGHAIRHLFKKTLKPGKCDHCSEYMFNGLKCKECKFKCHRDCEPKVPPSCSLPDDLVKYYVKQMTKEGSPILTHSHPYSTDPSVSAFTATGAIARIGSAIQHMPDSSSNTSSCNSSTPSSPAVMVTSTHPTPPHSASIYHKGTKFTFPDPPKTLNWLEAPPPGAGAMGGSGGGPGQLPKVQSPNPIIDSVKSCDSDKTLSGASGSSGSAGTAYRLDSQDSTASADDAASQWQAGRQTSISLREWDIPYEELVILDKIGSGRFSTVHQGSWHGDVAIKILNMENTDDDATLEAFRLDVSTFRKTRHENLILFMGACMNPPKLAIVTSLCKGDTLYTLLHLHKDKYPMNKLIIIAQQITQGMGYLHHRGIVHKDLKTKNIFLEHGRAIIADFGLVNVARRLCSHQGPPGISNYNRESMSIPKTWLCYLAPEIMRSLRVHPGDGEELPFTKASDVFAFGTIWFELLTGEWPWRHVPPETIIWLVGKGMGPSLANLQASKDVKDLLLICWTFSPDQRPDFTTLSDLLDKIPKKRGLIRSPSYPVHLWRSSESVF